MKTTGEFILHHFDITIKSYNDVVTIIPFGDCHYGAPLFAEDKWNEFIEDSKRLKNCYFLGMGDYMDVVSTSERRALETSSLHDSTEDSLEKFVKSEADKFCKSISFMKGRLLGMLGGNHYYRFSSGSTSDNYICDKLGTKYLGVKSMVHVSISPLRGNNTRSIVISAHHGEGGGRMPGSSINKLYHMSSGFDADIQLMGHDHKKMVDFSNRIGVNYSGGYLRMYNKKILMARTGSFLRGYVDGKRSYVCDANLPPNDLGVIKIVLKVNKRSETDISVVV